MSGRKARSIKDHLFCFAVKTRTGTEWYYETDKGYFPAGKPGMVCLRQKPLVKKTRPSGKRLIGNPWKQWDTNDIQMIAAAATGIPINYLKTTDQEVAHEKEDRNLIDLYAHIIDTYDIDRVLNFVTIRKWHASLFRDIYPFAGDLRTVEMSKDSSFAPWTWRLEFLRGIPELDESIRRISSVKFDLTQISDITLAVAEVQALFLFIHPFREGNGRIARLLGDIIYAKNGFPMIGMNLDTKMEDYIQAVQKGYSKDYYPLARIMEDKLSEKMISL